MQSFPRSNKAEIRTEGLGVPGGVFGVPYYWCLYATRPKAEGNVGISLAEHLLCVCVCVYVCVCERERDR